MATSEIIRVISDLKKLSDAAAALESGEPMRSIIRARLVSKLSDALIASGSAVLRGIGEAIRFTDYASRQVPGWAREVTSADLVEEMRLWADEVAQATPQLVGEGRFASILEFLEGFADDAATFTDRLMRGVAVGNPPSPVRSPATAADPIVLHRGEFVREAVDLAMQGAGIDFALRRTYRSQALYFGPLGPGWDHSYNLRLRQENEQVVVALTGALSEHRFIRHSRFGEAGFDYFAPPDGVHDCLTEDGAGSFIMHRPTGVTRFYEATGQPREHRVRRIEDRFGNFLQFTYDADGQLALVFVNSEHRPVEFAYDELGRVSRVTDHTGRFVEYTYDDTGLLESVAAPTLAGESFAPREHYEYDLNGAQYKLARVFDGEGRLRVENEYDAFPGSDHFGEIIRQADNRGETHFFYEDLEPEPDSEAPAADLPALRVIETRPNGHEVEHVLNESGNELLVRERLVDVCGVREATRRARYNADGEMITTVDPEGSVAQSLFGRDQVHDALGLAHRDVLPADVSMTERMSFGNVLATVQRWRRVLPDPEAGPEFWQTQVPAVTAPDDERDVVTKNRYDRDSQLLFSRSDPRRTLSADPRHVESAQPGDASFDPGSDAFILHQAHLTRHEYAPAPRHELLREVYPDRTRPSELDGITIVSGIVDEIVERDARGRTLLTRDRRGYEWFEEYFDASDGAREGFRRRRLVPHGDLLLTADTPAISEVAVEGEWSRNDNGVRSSGLAGDGIRVEVEGRRITLHQSSRRGEILGTNPAVIVTVNGQELPTWDQSVDARYVADGLELRIHSVEVRDTSGSSVALGRIESHTAEEFEVDALGRVVREIDARGHDTLRVFDGADRVVRLVTGPQDNRSVTTRVYDPDGRLLSEREDWHDAGGALRPERAVVRSSRYDPLGRVIAKMEGAEQVGRARVTRYRYDVAGNVAATIDARGATTQFFYDARDLQTRMVEGACTRDASITDSHYDRAGRLLAQRGPNGAIHLNGYYVAGRPQSGIDALGRVHVQTDPLGHMQVVDFDKLGHVITLRRFERPPGQGGFDLLFRQQIDHDEHGTAMRETKGVFSSPIFTADPVGAGDVGFDAARSEGEVEAAVTEFHLDAAGNQVAIRRAAGGIERRRFDGQGRNESSTDPEGRVVLRILDPAGNPRKIYAVDPVRDPDTQEVLHHEVFQQLHEFDALHRETARIDAWGNRWQQQFDTLGNLTSVIDPLGNVTRLAHNAFGEETLRIRERTDTGLPEGSPLPPLTRRFEYDAGGKPTALVDEAGRRTEHEYDALGRQVRTRFAVSLMEPAEVRTYDRAGNLVRVTDRNGLVKNYQYDLMDRHVGTVIDPSHSSTPLAPSSASFIMLRYDGMGNITRHQNDYCRVDIRFNSLSLPVSERVTFTNLPNAPGPLEFSRGFDIEERLTNLSYPSGRRVSYLYDHAGRLTEVRNVSAPPDYPGRAANASDFVVLRQRYAGRRPTRSDYGNGLALSLRYDGRGHALERGLEVAGEVLWRAQILRDAAGYVRRENSMHRTGERSRRFSLDSVYRLTHYADLPVTWLDADGVAPPHAAVDPFGAAGQALVDAALGPLQLPPVPAVFEYDASGNRLAAREPGLPIIESLPNELNQYVEVAGSPWEYDANGNLSSDGERRFAWDLDNRLQQIRELSTDALLCAYHRDATGRVIAETSTAGALFRIYSGAVPVVEVNAVGRLEFTPGGVSGPVVHAARAGEDFWFTWDGLSSLRVLTDGSGQVVSMPSYRPFGSAEDGELSLSPFHLGFASMWYTRGLPFDHSQFRTYRPDVGRHLQRDPAGQRDGTNLYEYVGNNPVHFSDPTGLSRIFSRTINLLLGMGEPPQLRIGREIEKQIFEKYKEQNPEDKRIYLDQKLVKVVKENQGSLLFRWLGAIRSDIVNVDKKHVYEIKSALAYGGSKLLGIRRQLGRYIERLNEAGIPVAAGPADAAGTHGTVEVGGVKYVFFTPEVGVIVYAHLPAIPTEETAAEQEQTPSLPVIVAAEAWAGAAKGGAAVVEGGTAAAGGGAAAAAGLLLPILVPLDKFLEVVRRRLDPNPNPREPT